MEDAPVSEVLKQLLIDNINPFWLQIEPSLEDWKAHLTDVPELIIGDVEFEVCKSPGTIGGEYAKMSFI